jgi:glycosyltransferase involved in cell wall biosynthesis
VVTVVTPTYQSAQTLPRALHSLLLQTYEDWEWIVINDGSTDETTAFFSDLGDSRIRPLTLEHNRGRGYVRNLALQHARGEFICSLDADDWFYPWKLEEQIRAFDSTPSLSAVTIGMAVTDEQGQLIGVQGRESRPFSKTIPGPRAMGFPFGPTMIKADLARQVGYDGSLRRGGDLDFFLRLMCGNDRKLGCLSRLGYVYCGHTSHTIAELLEGHRWSRKVYRRHLASFPLDCSYLTLSSYLKSIGYRASELLGVSDWLSLRRFSPCTPHDAEEYLTQLNRLAGKV